MNESKREEILTYAQKIGLQVEIFGPAGDQLRVRTMHDWMGYRQLAKLSEWVATTYGVLGPIAAGGEAEYWHPKTQKWIRLPRKLSDIGIPAEADLRALEEARANG